MKTIKKIPRKIKVTALIAIFSMFSAIGFSQPPPPPGGSTGPTGTGNQLGGNAPIGGGLFILLGLGAAYGGKKLYDLRQESTDYTD